MNQFIQKLLQQTGSRIIPRAVRSVQGFADDLAAPVLRGVGTLTENALVRSVGAVKDAVVRPGTRFSQQSNSSRTFRPGLSGQVQVMQQTAASLRPGPTSVQFPLNDPLTLLQGNVRYLQRQAQAGIDTSQGVFRNLQSLGPTALNPFATSTTTTALGKLGKAVNPLNPPNARGYLAGALLSVLPDSNPIKGNLEIAAFVPGGIHSKIAATTIFGATPAGSADESRLIRESNALRQSGQNYVVNGIEYDYKTGRALNPPPNVFVPARQDDEIDRSYQRDPAERSYQGELQRIAQLTAQNPELKRYEADRVKAKTQEERNAVRDMGLAIWQKEYGQKQIGKPGGAIGTFNPLMSTGNTTQTTGDQLVVPINTDEVPYQVGDFSRATLDSGYDPNAFGITPEMIEELQKRLLLQGIK